MKLGGMTPECSYPSVGMFYSHALRADLHAVEGEEAPSIECRTKSKGLDSIDFCFLVSFRFPVAHLECAVYSLQWASSRRGPVTELLLNLVFKMAAAQHPGFVGGFAYQTNLRKYLAASDKNGRSIKFSKLESIELLMNGYRVVS